MVLLAGREQRNGVTDWEGTAQWCYWLEGNSAMVLLAGREQRNGVTGWEGTGQWCY